MKRPENYKTKHGAAILSYLMAEKDRYVTVAQIVNHLNQKKVTISRPTIYRQLEKLVREEKVRRIQLEGSSGACFQYVDLSGKQRQCHLKCEVCHGLFDLKCEEVDHVAQHIFEDHEFQVNNSKTIFYGKCKTCL